MFEQRISDAMRTEEALPFDPLEKYALVDQRRRKRQAQDDMARRRLYEHIRAALSEDYDLRLSLWNISIELHGDPGSRLLIRFASNSGTEFSHRVLEDFPRCETRILIVRHGRGYPEVGDLINRLHEAHQKMQVLSASGRSLWLPGVKALDDFLDRLRVLLGPRLQELKRAQRRNRIKRLVVSLFHLALVAAAVGLAASAVLLAWKVLTSS